MRVTTSLSYKLQTFVGIGALNWSDLRDGNHHILSLTFAQARLHWKFIIIVNEFECPEDLSMYKRRHVGMNRHNNDKI